MCLSGLIVFRCAAGQVCLLIGAELMDEALRFTCGWSVFEKLCWNVGRVVHLQVLNSVGVQCSVVYCV